ncbi:MAG: hypothetical protein AAFY78_22860 [Cyanobacteria bacterium J06648_16]
MTRRSINFSAKAKRLRSLGLAILLSIVVPSVGFAIDYVLNGPPLHGWASFFAEQRVFLLMGGILVLNSLFNELYKKLKGPGQRELLGKLCGAYIVFALMSFAFAQTMLLDPVAMDEVYRLANFVFVTYQVGVGLSVACILAGKS